MSLRGWLMAIVVTLRHLKRVMLIKKKEGSGLEIMYFVPNGLNNEKCVFKGPLSVVTKNPSGGLAPSGAGTDVLLRAPPIPGR